MPQRPAIDRVARSRPPGSWPPDEVWLCAESHVRAMCARLGLAPGAVCVGRTAPTCQTSSINARAAHPELRRAEGRRVGRVTTAVFQQSQFDVPVWNAFVAVQIERALAVRIVGAQHSLLFRGTGANPRLGADVEPPCGTVSFAPRRDAFDILAWMIRARTGQTLIDHGRPPEQIFIYRYDESMRLGEIEAGAFGFRADDLGPAGSARDRFVTEVVARTEGVRAGGFWWRALIDVESGAALQLRALASNAFPAVQLFRADPVTLEGPWQTLTFGVGNWDVELDRYRAQLTFVDIPAEDESLMRSEFVEVVDIAPPPLRFPDVTGDGAREHRDRYLAYIRGDYFARATAVYHLDQCVRTIKSFGIDVDAFFSPVAERGTNPTAESNLPIKIDPRVDSIAGISLITNAMTVGNASGVEAVCIGPLAVDSETTAAIDPRFIWHEFGHVLLLTRDPRSNGNLPFAHGIGDALAAIHFDPDSAVREDPSLRGLCFPWFRNYRNHLIARRHDWRFDEPEEMIWACFNRGLHNQYMREEVLSSTLFRIYRAMGGDSPSAPRRRLASNYVLFLIVQAIGVAKIETIVGPRELRDLLIAADAGVDRGAFQDIPRGALEKVIEWAFDEQGLDAWKDDTGCWRKSPPAVDVFIDPVPQPDQSDACWPGYPESEFFWESAAIRNRLRPDEGVDHEPPRRGCDNFLHVRIRNRGRLSVQSPSVWLYYQEAVLAPVWHGRNTWPDQRRRWRPATPTRDMLPMPADSAAFQEAVFVWRPDGPGPWSFVAAVSARQGDAADCSSLETSDVVDRPRCGPDRALWALAPHDNNLAVRSIAAAAGGGGARALVASIDPDLSLSNPYSHRACVVRVGVELPAFLRGLGWSASVEPTSDLITLPPGGDFRVKLRITPGSDFAASDVPVAAAERRLRIVCVDVSHDPTDAHGIILGGVTYEIDRRLG